MQIISMVMLFYKKENTKRQLRVIKNFKKDTVANRLKKIRITKSEFAIGY
jgi:hypothetical protein